MEKKGRKEEREWKKFVAFFPTFSVESGYHVIEVTNATDMNRTTQQLLLVLCEK
jgi:hypothetical protein